MAAEFKVTQMTLLASLIAVARSCSFPGMSAKVPKATDFHFAQVVVYGKVLERLPDTRYGQYELPNVFAVRFQVYCIYKGAHVASVINITGAGHVPGLCHHTRLIVNQTYVVMLNERNGSLEPSRNDILVRNVTDSSLLQIANICDASLDYPTYSTAVIAELDCPKTTNKIDCESYHVPAVPLMSPGRNVTGVSTRAIPSMPSVVLSVLLLRMASSFL